jgi:potassium-dependent mechanosensitive channel
MDARMLPGRGSAIVLMLLLGLAAPAWAALPASQSAAIERQRGSLDQAGLDEATRREADTALAAATTAEQNAATAIEAGRRLREELAAAEKERRALQTRLNQEPTQAFRDWQRRLPDSEDPERFEALLAAERGEVVRLRAEAAQVASALAAFAAPPAEASVQEAELRLTIEDLERRLAAASASDLPPTLAEARRLRLRAELRAASAELQRRTVERDSAPLRREHLELRQRVLQRELSDREQRMELLQRMIADRTDARLGTLVDALEAVQPELADTPLLAREHALTLQIARELLSGHAALAELRRELRTREQQRDQVAASLRDTEARLALDSGSEALGLILQAERRRLDSPEALARRLEQIRSELARARLRQIDLSQQRAAVDDLDAALRRLLADQQRDSEDPAAQLASAETLRNTLGTRAELLPKLDALLQRRLTALEQTEHALQALWTDTVALRGLLDRRLLWIPSHARVDLGWLLRQPAGWHDLLKPSRFPTSGRLLLGRWLDAPWLPLAALLLASGLLYWRRGLRERLAALAPPRRVAGDSYRLTAQVFVQSVLAALPWAVLLWALGRGLQGAGAAGKYSDSLGHALVALAASVLLLDFLRWLVVERGLAHLHFRWTRARRDSLRRWLPWLAAVLLPTQLFATLAQAREVDLAVDTAGRLSLLAFALFAAFMLWRLLAAGALWTPRGGAPEPQRKRQLLRAGLPALLLAIVIALLDGYVYSSWVLLRCLWLSLWAVLLVALVHGMLARWFLLGERRLAWQRLQAQREAEQTADGSSQVDGETGAVDLPATDLTLEQVNAQTGRLLRALTLSLWVAALFWIWADVLPALARLDEIALWSYSTLAEDGSSVLEHVSLKGLLLGIIVLVLTFIAAGNLPGLLEIGLLTRISIDASTRYAIASVSRYLIVILGAMIGLGLLGLRWSQLQWMAAAFSVGLGFGLQEIFGNFVSGLILLFERPFRVGDVITIGEYTGTVSRVRTRATTLIDFDNKEVVVPNKTFITERLINWTLSDTRTRITLKIGVAYGSDPQQVHALLQRAAAEHPLVQTDPPPRSWFMGFGASALDFELRVFVDAMSDRLPVTNDLNTRIAALFADAGVEIAFPQMDLRVKEFPQGRGVGDAGGALVGER